MNVRELFTKLFKSSSLRLLDFLTFRRRERKHFCSDFPSFVPFGILKRPFSKPTMIFSTKRSKWLLGAGAVAISALCLGSTRLAVGSDHADTFESAGRPGIDLSDLHIFPGQDANNIVFSMSVHPLIPAGQSAKFSFDPNVLYQFKIDTTGDNVEDLVIQARFQGTGANQKVFIAGPVKPSRVGTVTQFQTPYSKTGVINKVFTPVAGMKVYAGAREDPFFIDLVQLGNILPDRLTPTGLTKAPADGPNTPHATSWRKPGEAQDFLKDFNVLAIVVEMPKSMLGSGTKKIGVWETTSTAN